MNTEEKKNLPVSLPHYQRPVAVASAARRTRGDGHGQLFALLVADEQEDAGALSETRARWLRLLSLLR